MKSAKKSLLILNKAGIPAFLGIISFLAGCTTPPPTYKYEGSIENAATFKVTSEFSTHTFFKVNNKNTASNQCIDFQTVGFILNENSSLIYDKPNKEFSFKSEGNTPVIISAMHDFSNGSIHSTCGPVNILVKPEKSMTYNLLMKRTDLKGSFYCNLVLTDANNKAVPFEKIDKCKK